MARKVMYVGPKESRADTVTGSGLVWKHGEVLPVAPSIAMQLCRYPDIWKDVTDSGQEDTQADVFGDAEGNEKIDDIVRERNWLRGRVAELEEERVGLLEMVERFAPRGEEEEPEDAHNNAIIFNLKKNELIEYAQQTLGLDLDPKLSKEQLRDRVMAEAAARA